MDRPHRFCSRKNYLRVYANLSLARFNLAWVKGKP